MTSDITDNVDGGVAASIYGGSQIINAGGA
jgi:hypothetical protein